MLHPSLLFNFSSLQNIFKNVILKTILETNHYLSQKIVDATNRKGTNNFGFAAGIYF